MLCTMPPSVVIADARVSEQQETCRRHEDLPLADGRLPLMLYLTLDKLRMAIIIHRIKTVPRCGTGLVYNNTIRGSMRGPTL
jgi:hypothetical protein